MVLLGSMVEVFVADDELFVLVPYHVACTVDTRKLCKGKVCWNLSVEENQVLKQFTLFYHVLSERLTLVVDCNSKCSFNTVVIYDRSTKGHQSDFEMT